MMATKKKTTASPQELFAAKLLAVHPHDFAQMLARSTLDTREQRELMDLFRQMKGE